MSNPDSNFYAITRLHTILRKVNFCGFYDIVDVTFIKHNLQDPASMENRIPIAYVNVDSGIWFNSGEERKKMKKNKKK